MTKPAGIHQSKGDYFHPSSRSLEQQRRTTACDPKRSLILAKTKHQRNENCGAPVALEAFARRDPSKAWPAVSVPMADNDPIRSIMSNLEE